MSNATPKKAKESQRNGERPASAPRSADRVTTECLDCAIDWHDDCADRRRDDDRDGCCCGRIGGRDCEGDEDE